jgi:hypothetical protein
MAVRKTITNFAVAIGFSALSGLALASLVGAALTGAIDGGARGPADVIELSSRPVAFWFSVAAHALIAALAGGAAVAFWRKSVAA